MIRALILSTLAVGAFGAVGWQSSSSSDSYSNIYPTNKFWDYTSGDSGQTSWGGLYPYCDSIATITPAPLYLNGVASSVQTAKTGVDLLKTVSNNAQSVMYIQNWRNTIKTTFDDANPFTITFPTDTDLNGATLGAEAQAYKMSHMEWRWGSSTYGGAEHNLETSGSDVIELLMYFYNSNTITGSTGMTAFKAATESTNAILTDKVSTAQDMMVISIPFKAAAGGYNSNVQKLLTYLPVGRGYGLRERKYQVPSVTSSNTFDLKTLFPSAGSNYNSWMYPGQLTMPPCTQAVRVVMQTANEMSLGQAAVIRVGVYNDRIKRIDTNQRRAYSVGTKQTKVYKVSK